MAKALTPQATACEEVLALARLRTGTSGWVFHTSSAYSPSWWLPDTEVTAIYPTVASTVHAARTHIPKR
jgi:hypothetical protein